MFLFNFSPSPPRLDRTSTYQRLNTIATKVHEDITPIAAVEYEKHVEREEEQKVKMKDPSFSSLLNRADQNFARSTSPARLQKFESQPKYTVLNSNKPHNPHDEMPYQLEQNTALPLKVKRDVVLSAVRKELSMRHTLELRLVEQLRYHKAVHRWRESNQRAH